MKVVQADPIKIGPKAPTNYVANPPEGRATEEQLHAFMQEFWDMTKPHPFARGMRMLGYVGVELRPVKFEGIIHIASIISFYKKNAGEASAALKSVCDLADKHQLPMDLSVKPIKNAGSRDGKDLNATQLKAWYGRFGFKPAKYGAMVRKPKPLP